MNGFGKRLKVLREQGSLTTDQMAEQIGFTKSVIWSYEMEKKEPSVRHIMRIAEFFDVSIDYLLKGTKLKRTINLQHKNDMKNHTLIVDNIVLSNEEIADAVAFIKAKRLLKEAEF
ncbi:helix-turn-helix domain-containing protein [Ornithinibacillus sp. L9]|uniref:Helix-turn-helix domain-containing protein n=1 Tax=Ornithinibacillus caprae TaxID=2678566 RepID=A0A6N8FGJ6_9BACI|nr:helix-turn-helix transcriptional regulator [Ornithinibacillus caprae]MUK88593.1 helix-turn-helix domain-containing protein [Ornithinibacillus caprae]